MTTYLRYDRIPKLLIVFFLLSYRTVRSFTEYQKSVGEMEELRIQGIDIEPLHYRKTEGLFQCPFS